MFDCRYKGKKYKGMVEVCKDEDLMEEFCRNVCIKLECCPYIISPLHVADYCPENCQQMTKTKYSMCVNLLQMIYNDFSGFITIL